MRVAEESGKREEGCEEETMAINQKWGNTTETAMWNVQSGKLETETRVYR